VVADAEALLHPANQRQTKTIRVVTRRLISTLNTKDFIHLGILLAEATRRATDFTNKPTLSGSGPIDFSSPIFLPRALSHADSDTAKMATALRNLLIPIS